MQGQGDFALSERGRQQATRLAYRLAGDERPDAIYASPLLRTRATAEAIAAAVGEPVHTLPDLREYDFGDLSGLTWAEIAERFPDLIAAVRARTPEYPHYPGEEGRANFRTRVCNTVWALAAEHADAERIAVVTHAGPIVVACIEVLGLPYQRPAPFAVENASITTIDFRANGASLETVNDTCHLEC